MKKKKSLGTASPPHVALGEGISQLLHAIRLGRPIEEATRSVFRREILGVVAEKLKFLKELEELESG